MFLILFTVEFDYKQAPAVVVSDADSKYRYTGSIGIYFLFGSSPDSVTQTAYFRTSIDKWNWLLLNSFIIQFQL